jgi:hypothetical protein
MKMESLDSKWRGIISSEGAELFESRYPNLLVCYDVGAVFTAIGSYFRLEGLPESVTEDFSPDTIAKATADAFLILLNRGALDGFLRMDPIPQAAQDELNKMSGIAPAITDLKAVALIAQNSKIDECAADFKKLNSRSFKMHWMTSPERQAIFESACAAGRI